MSFAIRYLPCSHMKKRDFIKLAGATMAGAAINSAFSCSTSKNTETIAVRNWAGNLQYKSKTLLEPATVTEVADAMRENSRLRMLGTRHCFNRIADTDAPLLSTAKLNKIIRIDADSWSVTVEGGTRYGEFCREIDQAGFAIHNLASLPHISVAGACATATHGSGVGNGNLATAVAAMEIITAAGDVLELSRDRDRASFPGAVVHLGALGVVTRLTLDVEPTFTMRQDVYEDLPMAQLRDHFEDIVSAGYSVSLFTDWQGGRVNEVWLKRRIGEGAVLDAGPEF